jgi:hypothetical protein
LFIWESVVAEDIICAHRPTTLGDETDLERPERHPPIFAIEICVYPGASPQVQTARAVDADICLVAFGAQVARTEQPDASESCAQLLHESPGDSGKNLLQIQAGSRL